MNKFLKRTGITLLIIIGILVILAIGFRLAVRLDNPVVENADAMRQLKRQQIAPNVWTYNDNWLRKNSEGLYELYVSGAPYELGYKNGLLTQDLVQYQEQAFVDKLMVMIPSKSYLKFLRYFVAWFNKDMDKYVPVPMQQEIYGVSQSASPEYDFIAPPYHRILNYHGAHDIGHALQNLNLVACTAFGAWNNRTADSSIIIGRNFDFYMGDEFARDKIVAFYRPTDGYNFAFITWGGMTGVVSGMNVKGLTITLNSAKSSIPFSAKMPVSLLAREILQHAANIQEAYAIAQQHQTFVSESFLIGSAADNKVVVIEKSADKIDIYDPNGSEIVLTNHFQGDAFKNDSMTIESRYDGASDYRYRRVQELMAAHPKLDVNTFANILRDRAGLSDTDIGNGNEKAINQLIAHHSVIFKPLQLQMWVSTNPCQMGKYVMYDLNHIFNDSLDCRQPVNDTLLTIDKDPFLTDGGYPQYQTYKQLSDKLIQEIKSDNPLSSTVETVDSLIALNPNYYHAWLVAGEYYNKAGNLNKAIECYQKGLTLEIPRVVDRQQLVEKQQEAQEKLTK